MCFRDDGVRLVPTIASAVPLPPSPSMGTKPKHAHVTHECHHEIGRCFGAKGHQHPPTRRTLKACPTVGMFPMVMPPAKWAGGCMQRTRTRSCHPIVYYAPILRGTVLCEPCLTYRLIEDGEAALFPWSDWPPSPTHGFIKLSTTVPLRSAQPHHPSHHRRLQNNV